MERVAGRSVREALLSGELTAEQTAALMARIGKASRRGRMAVRGCVG